MKTMIITDDTRLTVPTVKLKCECGWTEKSNRDRTARERAVRHMKDRHNGGVVRYNDQSFEVT